MWQLASVTDGYQPKAFHKRTRAAPQAEQVGLG